MSVIGSMRHARVRATALAFTAAATVLSACGGLSQAQTRETLPPLPAPGVNLAAPTIPNIAAPESTAPVPTGPVEVSNSDPVSVAGRFLTAAQNDNADIGTALALGDRDPSVFGWAASYHDSIVAVAGPDAWSGPSCAEPTNGTTSCTWLLNDPTTSLVLIDDGGTWKVSHPLQVPTGEGISPIGTGCIVGNDNVRVRGGPGVNWPRFTDVAAGRCGIEFFTPVLEGERGPWRLVRVDGQLGWIVERVLRSA